MAYDAARERVVLFGGASEGAPENDLWEWDGDAWAEITPEGPSPSARDAASLAYDAAQERLVLFGGFDEDSAEGCTNDTWALGDRGWTALIPDGASPERRDAASMAYDAARERVVLFGGWPCRSLDALEDTWVGSFLEDE